MAIPFRVRFLPTVNLLAQPSTWAGFAGLAVTAGISAPQYSAVTTAIAALASLAAVFVNESPPVSISTPTVTPVVPSTPEN